MDALPLDGLADLLDTLGDRTRLRVLAQLQSPKILSQVRVRSGSDQAEGRLLARQTIRQHLDRLMEEGLVTTREAVHDYGPTTAYLLDHQRLYALSEQLRLLSHLSPTEDPEGDTLDATDRRRRPADQGPQLVLVKGVDVGRGFRLDPSELGPGPWTIGRRRDAHLPLDFDPYVSTDHAIVRREGNRIIVEDLPESRNGTWLNFEKLPPGSPAALDPADILGVGSSLLVFRT